ncbi:MAG: hypothetical protein AAF403_05895 [Pseudomonadota bacterium]
MAEQSIPNTSSSIQSYTDTPLERDGQAIKDYHAHENSHLVRQQRFKKIKEHTQSNPYYTENTTQKKLKSKTIVEPPGLENSPNFVLRPNNNTSHDEKTAAVSSILDDTNRQELTEVQRITNFKYRKMSVFFNVLRGIIGLAASLLPFMIPELSSYFVFILIALSVFFVAYILYGLSKLFFKIKIDDDGLYFESLFARNMIKWQLIETFKLRYYKSAFGNKGWLSITISSENFFLVINNSISNFSVLLACFAQCIRTNRLPLDVLSLNNFAITGHLFSHIDKNGSVIDIIDEIPVDFEHNDKTESGANANQIDPSMLNNPQYSNPAEQGHMPNYNTPEYAENQQFETNPSNTNSYANPDYSTFTPPPASTMPSTPQQILGNTMISNDSRYSSPPPTLSSQDNQPDLNNQNIVQSASQNFYPSQQQSTSQSQNASPLPPLNP